MKDFVFPPSLQSDLFRYLKPQQQAEIKPVLRIIKRKYQEDVCIVLLDYLEGNGILNTGQPAVDRLAQYLISTLKLNPLRKEPEEPEVKRTFKVTEEPQSITSIIKQLFPELPLPASLRKNSKQ